MEKANPRRIACVQKIIFISFKCFYLSFWKLMELFSSNCEDLLVVRDANHSDNDRKSHLSVFIFANIIRNKEANAYFHEPWVRGWIAEFPISPTQYAILHEYNDANHRSVAAADVFGAVQIAMGKWFCVCMCVACITTQCQPLVNMRRKQDEKRSETEIRFFFFPIRWKATIIHGEDTSHTCHMESILWITTTTSTSRCIHRTNTYPIPARVE